MNNSADIAPDMSNQEKKAYLLLMATVFSYHGLDEDEQSILDSTAQEIQGEEELAWAKEFIDEGIEDAFERAKDYLSDIKDDIPESVRLDFLTKCWKANNTKGYITEMEAMAMLRLAKVWKVERDLLKAIKS
jgi:hypothetical protein